MFDDPWASQRTALTKVGGRKCKPFLDKHQLEHKVKTFKRRKSEVFHGQSGHKAALSKYQSSLKKALLHQRKNGKSSDENDNASDQNKSDTSTSGAMIEGNDNDNNKNNSSPVQADTEQLEDENQQDSGDTEFDDTPKGDAPVEDNTYCMMKDIFLQMKEEDRLAELKKKQAEEAEARQKSLEKIKNARKQLEQEFGPMSDEQFKKIQERMGLSLDDTLPGAQKGAQPLEIVKSDNSKVKPDADSSLPNILISDESSAMQQDESEPQVGDPKKVTVLGGNSHFA